MAGGILGGYIDVPIIVSKEDPGYIRMQEILKEIKRIKKENYWLIAIPNSNDTILGYALKASGNEDEVIALAREIALKNGFNSINDNLTEGKSIWVINQRLGELKDEFNEVQDKLMSQNIKQYNLTKTNSYV